jgi:hypothetical protein
MSGLCAAPDISRSRSRRLFSAASGRVECRWPLERDVPKSPLGANQQCFAIGRHPLLRDRLFFRSTIYHEVCAPLLRLVV